MESIHSHEYAGAAVPAGPPDSPGGTAGEPEEKFTPRGAMAFFGLMLLAYIVMWGLIYIEMMERR